MNKLNHGVGGDGFSIRAAGQEASKVAAPADALDVLVGKGEGFGEERLPDILRQGCF